MPPSILRAPRQLGAGAACAFALLLARPAPAATRYIFSTFYGDAVADEKLGIYTSTDGLNFTLLSKTGYGGPTGVLRDPSIMKHSDGKYYVAYTVQSWTTNSTSFAIASSSDLRAWTFHTEVPSGIANTRFTWAPEWFVDSDGVHLIVNIEPVGSDSDFRSYDFKAKDATLKSWEAPQSMGIGPNNIDTFVVKEGATYHAFSKNETTKFIEHATASTLHGPWTWVQKGDFAGWGSGKEGIALFKLDNGSWRMFLDCYSGCGFLYADSTDLSKWSKTASVPGISGIRHGTVLRDEDGQGGAAGSAGSGGATGGKGAGGADSGSGGGVAEGGRGGASQGGALGRGGDTGTVSNGGVGSGGASNAGASQGGESTASHGGRDASSGGSAGPSAGGASASASLGGSPSNPTGGAAPATGGGSALGNGGAPSSDGDDDASSGCTFAASTTNGAWASLAVVALMLTGHLGRRRTVGRKPGRS